MPHLPSLRLLFPSPSSPLSKTPFFGYPISRSLFSTSRPPLNPGPPLTVLSYSGARGRRTTGGARGRRTSGGRGGGFLHQRRGTSTLREERGRGRAPEMEEKEGTLGFNKRRAEGRDKSGKPKTLQLKTRKLNPVNTICYVQILGTGMDTQDTSPSVLLFFDKQRFIFNAGEGLQRFCTEHKIKLSKIDHIFFTRVCSETAGGLAGLLLTLAGVGEEGMSVNIWGPSDLNYLVDAMRSFIPNAAVVHAHSFGVTKDGDGDMLSSSEFGKLSDPIIIIDDEVVRIFAIPLNPSYSNGLTLKPGDVAVSYACELPEIKGKFDPIKAAALGLKPGPKYRELQLGNSVMSDSLNIMVHPSDVLGPSSPGPIILLVDCPTTFHMLELLSTESLNCYYRDFDHLSIENCKVVKCVIHLGPAFVTKSADYQKWMKRFGTVQHIMAGHEIKNMEIPILKSSARISSQLNYLCPQLFPAPGCWSSQQTNELSLQSSELCEDPSPIPCESILAENLLKFHLRPYSQLGLDRSAIPASLNHEEVIAHLLSEVPEIADVAKNVNQFWQSSAEGRLKPPKDDNCIMVEEPWLSASSSVNNVHTKKQGRDSSEGDIPHLNDRWKDNLKYECDIPACLENISREDMEIVLLGTGSSQPSKYRNVSSIFVNLFSRGSLLFDCGEGTLAQLKRRFGIEGADDAVKGLKCIWISHIHADHHTGLARILALRCQLLKDVPHKPLLVIGPRPLKRFLDAYSRLEDLDMQFLDCRHTLEASINAFHGSLDSREDHFPGTSDKDVEGSTTENIASHPIISSLFTAHSKMQSYWKRPGSPVDTSAALPVLMRLKEVLSEAGLEVLYSVPVVHCPQAFGVVLKAAERLNRLGKTIPGWKVVYSGDTRPCEALINASRDATLLIHEATFEDTMENEAIARNHSTTKEAVGVGTSAGAYRVILTHFSQRYPKIPVFNEADMQRTCIAFDLMTVNLADLPLLPKFLPYLKVLFRNELEADESDDVHESFVY